MREGKWDWVKNHLYIFLPYLLGSIATAGLVCLKEKYNLDCFNIKSFDEVLGSIISFGSIVIGFYSAFYGIIVSMQRSKFMVLLRQSKYNKSLPNQLLFSLLSAFSSLIMSIMLQVLINYESIFILVLYYVWGFITIVFITYSLQTSILSIALIFGSEGEEKQTKDI